MHGIDMLTERRTNGRADLAGSLQPDWLVQERGRETIPEVRRFTLQWCTGRRYRGPQLLCTAGTLCQLRRRYGSSIQWSRRPGVSTCRHEGPPCRSWHDKRSSGPRRAVGAADGAFSSVNYFRSATSLHLAAFGIRRRNLFQCLCVA